MYKKMVKKYTGNSALVAWSAPDVNKPISKNKRANITKLSGFFAKHFSLFLILFNINSFVKAWLSGLKNFILFLAAFLQAVWQKPLLLTCAAAFYYQRMQT
jgi:hypothetical protein